MLARAKTTCPNCWHRFDSHDVLWVSAHPGLRGDVQLGTDAFRRFLPSRFSPRANALDEKGEECTQLACPRCHLPLPWVSLEMEPWFVSVFGTPSSGKSYFLAAMTNRLRRGLPQLFRVSLTDSDAVANETLVGYEDALFSNRTPHEDVPLGQLIAKTAEHGDLYNVVTVGGNRVEYPQPFLFNLLPTAGHACAADPGAVSRVVCLYDNAGESFRAGSDSLTSPVTRHLAESALRLFLFDPVQHPPFHQRLVAKKLAVASDLRTGGPATRQDLLLTEAASRVRQFASRSESDARDRPLVVVVTKKDLWGALVPELSAPGPVIAHTSTRSAVLNIDRLHEQSGALRRLLRDVAPEVVTAAESFAPSVVYIGVSALGTPPTQHPFTKKWSIRPDAIRPDGVELPILYGLHLHFPRLIPGHRPSDRGNRHAV